MYLIMVVCFVRGISNFYFDKFIKYFLNGFFDFVLKRLVKIFVNYWVYNMI